MSWNRSIFKKFNRQNEREKCNYLLNFFYKDDTRHLWDTHEEFKIWADILTYDGDGKCHSMKEYHQMHLLTLLRRLGIKSAEIIICDRGWWY